MGAPYIYDISHLRVNRLFHNCIYIYTHISCHPTSEIFSVSVMIYTVYYITVTQCTIQVVVPHVITVYPKSSFDKFGNVCMP